MKVIKSKSSKAGLIFPVARIDRYLRKCTHHYRISTATAIYIAAVMEYLTEQSVGKDKSHSPKWHEGVEEEASTPSCRFAEVLELAGAAAKDNRKRRITPRHILLAVANDDELKEMLKTVTIPSAGVIPNIIFLSNNVQKPLIKHKLQTSAKVHTNKKKQETKGNKKKQETKIYINKKQKTTKPKSTKSKRSNKTMKKKSSAVRPKQCIPQQNVPDKPNVKKYNPGDTPKVTILSEKKLFLGQRLTVVQGSIVDVMADAIVNPTNASFFMGGQVGKTLLQEGGEKFEKEVNDLKSANTLAPAAAAICPGYNFVAEYVIHCNGPTSYSNASIDLLKKTIKSCLSLADSKNLESLALPSIGSGRAGFPKVEAAKVILEAIGNYFSTVMSTSIKQIYFVLYDKESIDAYTKEILNLNI